MLYHYTGDNNFERILRNRTISLTQSTSSNDIVDTIYISQILKKYSKEIFSKVVNSSTIEKDKIRESDVDRFATHISGLFSMFCNDLYNNNSTSSKTDKCFVICFSEKPDSRFFWETYASDIGVSIGIDLEELKNHINTNYNDVRMGGAAVRFKKVIYKEDEQK